jgi:CcmD family protein
MSDSASSAQASSEQRSQETAADRRSEFVPVAPGGETSSAEALLITAYIVMWALIFGLIFASQRRQRKIDQRLTDLEASLKRLDQAALGKDTV